MTRYQHYAALGLLFSPLLAQEAPDRFPLPGAQEENHRMRVTVRVVDEQGNPLVGVPVRIGIHNVNDFLDEYNDFYGKSDEQGRFSAEAVGRPLAKIEIKADGYYPSLKTVSCNKGSAELIRKGGRYLPWDPVVDVMIKKVGKPIPMRVWRTDRSHFAPKTDGEIGFDLYEKDWVKPHGQGTHADLLVKFSTRFIDQNDYSTTCSIRFFNPDDGFIPIPELMNPESELKYPRMAPDDGYALKQLKITRGSTGNEARSSAVNKEPMGYIIRFRSVKDDEVGEIISAYYGKITSPRERSGNVNPFEVYSLDRVNRKLVSAPSFRFSMYVNPTPNDRNLEYDQRTNLAPEADRGLIWPP
ncbi:MAG: carboxypeptidase-like regulatory domain-containing protein [Akkermansiaceae bacterium]